MAGMLGLQDLNADQMSQKFDEMLVTIKQVNEQFKNAVRITYFKYFYSYCNLERNCFDDKTAITC